MPNTKSPMKDISLDIGKQTGLYDTDKIRQRIHRWQADSAGDARTEDKSNVIVVEYEKEPDNDKLAKKTTRVSPDKTRIRPRTDKDTRQSSPTKSQKSPREIDSERQAWVRRKNASRNELDADVKHAAAPLKRVVSDAHWRKDRPPIEAPGFSHQSSPRPYTIKRTRVYKEPPPEAKKDDNGIRVTPTRNDDGIRITPMKDDDGIRIYPMADKNVTDTKSAMRHKARNSTSDRDDYRPKDSKQDKPSDMPRDVEVNGGGRNRHNPNDSEVRRDNSDRRRRLRRRHASPSASEPDTDIGSITQTLVPDDSISTRNGHSRRQPKSAEKPVRDVIADEGPTRLTKTTASAKNPHGTAHEGPATKMSPVFGNRIEAWLTGTPDGLVADKILRDTAETSRIHPSKHQSQGISCKEESLNRRDSLGESTRHFKTYSGNQATSARHTADYKTKSQTDRTMKTIAEPSSTILDDEVSSYATSSVSPSDTAMPDVRTDKHKPGANLRRSFPTTGQRLSTIASAETLQETTAPSEVSEQDTIVLDRTRSSKGVKDLKRRLTRHEDLISVLSVPKADTKSIVSARSIRTNRTRLEKATMQDLWNELFADEEKYQRELRTLVDGVIPVLLSCVLSKSNSTVAAGLFGRSTSDDTTITKPIIDMGVALERLKAHHRRVPNNGRESALLAWAQGAIRIYIDYLKAWRMGFQDVVVNLAPADASNNEDWDDGLPRNDDGDLINGDGERVDVAFLLKRPLVRLKYLAKTFKGINFLAPSTLASAMADKYQELVTEARKRSNEERGRLEDEAAASIDPTRARDLQSLAPLTGVIIDARRCVRARDYFDLDLIHSSGQQLDCKVELLIRDDVPERGTSGDVLICEICDNGRWLLFPPIKKEFVSARAGKGPGDVVLMIRGRHSNCQEWHELLALHANDESTGPEWLDMLGLSPIPPQLARKSSFLTQPQGSPCHHTPVQIPSTVDIPIGEQPCSSYASWTSTQSTTEVSESSIDHSNSFKPIGRKGRSPGCSKPRNSQNEISIPKSPYGERIFDDKDMQRSSEPSLNLSGLKRSKATRHKSSPPISPSSSRSSLLLSNESESRDLSGRPPPTSRSEIGLTTLSSYSSQSTLSKTKKDFSVWLPQSTIPSDDSDSDKDEIHDMSPDNRSHSHTHRRVSSVPTLSPTHTSSPKKPNTRRSPYQADAEVALPSLIQTQQAEQPAPTAVKLQKRQPSGPGVSFDDILVDHSTKEQPPKPKRFSIPSFTPNFLKRHRRSSSPLKHEYEPSIEVESSTESESSYSDDDDESITSESSDEVEVDFKDVKDVVTAAIGSANPFERTMPPESLASLPNNTVSPSQSASQAPYRAVPQQANHASRTIASVFSWSDQGVWESLHPHECAVVVTPGLIEAFDIGDAKPMNSDNSDMTSPSARGVNPLIAFEVTPLVPLRRGTALDISIRSPPTVNSLIRASNNVMFRSRNAEECDILYSLINTARINNPTYIALQNARRPFNESAWSSASMNRPENQQKSSGSWFHNPLRRSNTYRSKASRPQSMTTDSSVGTMNTAFSALRRFNGNNRLFNIARSTITSRQGSRSGTSETLSSGTSTPVVYDPSQGAPLGIANAKVRLYVRETQNKWRDMGSARLSILLPPRPSSGGPPSPRSAGMEKRILVAGKTKGETLLDVTLGESCFERVARTGIAVSVWQDKTSPGAIGGVGTSKAITYMIQHKTERECAYTFSLVGKLRY